MNSFKRFLGTICLLIGISLFSTIEICQKIIVGQAGCHMDPYMMVFVRFAVTGILLLTIGLPILHHQGRRLALRDWMNFTINGITGITLSLSLFHFAIDQFANASSAAVVFSANAIFVVIFARFINGEPWTLGKWIAMLLGLAGISLFIFEQGTPNTDTLKAIGMMSISAMLFAISVCFTKRTIAKCGAMVFMGGSSLMGSLLSLPMFFLLSSHGFMEAIRPMQSAWTAMGYMVVIATAIAYCFYYTGISCTSAFHSSMVFMLKPVLACVLAMVAHRIGILSSERPMNTATITGTALIVVAMCIAQLCRAAGKKPADAKAQKGGKKTAPKGSK